MDYQPPPREELLRLRDEELDFTNAQMAAMFGLSSGGQFHKYISEKDRREMGFHVLMYGMLQLALRDGYVTSVEQLHEMARSYGALIELTRDGEPQP